MFFSKIKLKDKVAIVTGSGRGIGKAIALILAENRCKVVICSRTKKELDKVQKEIKRKNTDVLSIKCDVSKPLEIKKVVKETLKKFKKINILVNNAGIGPYKPFINHTQREIDSIIDVNLKGTMYFTKEVLEEIQKQDFGRIINISSGVGKKGIANFSVYCASKFGIIGFTEALGKELGGNIKAYAVCPKGTDTKLYHDNFPNSRNIFLDTPKSVARAVLKACKQDCKMENGKVIDV